MTDNCHILHTQNFDYDKYDNNLAKVLCCFQEMVYLSEYFLSNHFSNTDYKNFEFFDKNGCQAFAVTTDKFLVISFRGTQILKNIEIKDFWPHFTFKKSLDKGYKLHKGYYEFYKNIRESIKRYVAKNGYGKQVLLTGHSLGGTLAQIAGEIDFKEQIVYAFGATRAISPQSTTTNKRIYSLTTSKDVVSNYPTRFTGLIHIGKRLTFTNSGNLEPSNQIKNLAVETTLSAIGSMILPFYWMFGIRLYLITSGIRSHSIHSYKDKVKKYASKRDN